MTERERLIEYIQNSVRGITRTWAGIIADCMLANGVIAPPVKVGQTVWFVRGGKIIETTVEKIVEKHGGTYFKMGCNSVYETAVSAIDRTVFLNLHDAERELERSRG